MNRRVRFTGAWLATLSAILTPSAAANGGSFAHEQAVVPSSGPFAAFGLFGSAVAVSGETLAVGAPEETFFMGNDQGTVRVYVRLADGWTEQATLTHPFPTSWADFGTTVDLEGDTLVVGCPLDSSTLGFQAGSVVVFTRSGTVWDSGTVVVPADLEPGYAFGGRVALEGERMLVGAVGAAGVGGIGGGAGEGAAYVFERIGGTWTETAKLIKAAGEQVDNFGRGVALFGNTALIGDPTDSVDGVLSGSATFFQRVAGTWIEGATVVAPDVASGASFGFDVALYGHRAVIGAWQDGDGSAHVYQELGGAWIHEIDLADLALGAHDSFGWSVATEGERILVGSPDDAQDKGSVYIFERSAAQWTLSQWLQSQAPCGFPTGVPCERLGSAVALAGEIVLGGAIFNSSVGQAAGAAHVFRGPDPVVVYCTAGTSASGCLALLSSGGTPSATAPAGFFLHAFDVEGNKQGLFFFGTSGPKATPFGNGTSWRCVAQPVARGSLLPGTGTAGVCDGAFSYDLNAHWTAKPSHNPGEGALVNAQLWYRDPLNTGSETSSFSDGIEFTVCP